LVRSCRHTSGPPQREAYEDNHEYGREPSGRTHAGGVIPSTAASRETMRPDGRNGAFLGVRVYCAVNASLST
jgi:hypothetical protein